MSRWKYPGGLLAIFLLFWLALAINPTSRADWLLENLLTAVAVPLFVLTRNKLRFSAAAYTCLFVFFCIHTIGSHYTYSLVPYDEWWRTLTGETLNGVFGFERNHYDRLVHFLYGALMLLPALELFAVYAPPRGPWRFIMPVSFLMAHSVIYELIEWVAALTAAPELGQAYLGTQGDIWDSQQDMALATLGAIIALGIVRASPRWRSLAA
jgi:putative membrane protein